MVPTCAPPLVWLYKRPVNDRRLWLTGWTFGLRRLSGAGRPAPEQRCSPRAPTFSTPDGRRGAPARQLSELLKTTVERRAGACGRGRPPGGSFTEPENTRGYSKHLPRKLGIQLKQDVPKRLSNPDMELRRKAGQTDETQRDGRDHKRFSTCLCFQNKSCRSTGFTKSSYDQQFCEDQRMSACP